ncbi:MAG: LysR family transcriptional regulator [Candidatus Limivicinus sp.]|jgi:LysR family cyn operon transcriptional activator
MDFDLLKNFIAVADEKSISKASKHLFISQQSLSKQLAKLESELGTQLLIRSRPMRLTQDGMHFLSTAKEILQLKQQFEDNSSRGLGGSHFIHVGIEHTVARTILPYVLPKFMREHPDTYVKVSEDSPEILQRAVAHDGVDLAIGSINDLPESYETVHLCKKEQLLLVPRDITESIAGGDSDKIRKKFKKSADLSFFEKAPFIKIPSQSSGGRALNSYMKYYDISLRFVCELTNMENAFQLCYSGVGILIYPKLFWDTLSEQVQNECLEKLDVFPLPYLPDIDDVCAYYNRKAGLHQKTRVLLDDFMSFFKAYSSGSLEK